MNHHLKKRLREIEGKKVLQEERSGKRATSLIQPSVHSSHGKWDCKIKIHLGILKGCNIHFILLQCCLYTDMLQVISNFIRWVQSFLISLWWGAGAFYENPLGWLIEPEKKWGVSFRRHVHNSSSRVNLPFTFSFFGTEKCHIFHSPYPVWKKSVCPKQYRRWLAIALSYLLQESHVIFSTKMFPIFLGENHYFLTNDCPDQTP